MHIVFMKMNDEANMKKPEPTAMKADIQKEIDRIEPFLGRILAKGLITAK